MRARTENTENHIMHYSILLVMRVPQVTIISSRANTHEINVVSLVAAHRRYARCAPRVLPPLPMLPREAGVLVGLRAGPGAVLAVDGREAARCAHERSAAPPPPACLLSTVSPPCPATRRPPMPRRRPATRGAARAVSFALESPMRSGSVAFLLALLPALAVTPSKAARLRGGTPL